MRPATSPPRLASKHVRMATLTNAINETLYDKLNFTFHRDLAPVAGVMRAPQVIDVNSSSPVKTLPEFIAYAKANPGKLIMGSGDVGTSQHAAGELFQMMTGVNMVQYRGGAPANCRSARRSRARDVRRVA